MPATRPVSGYCIRPRRLTWPTRARSAWRHGTCWPPGTRPPPFDLLSERVVRDFLVNPTLGSALDLDEFQPDLFADAPEILVPLAAELLCEGPSSGVRVRSRSPSRPMSTLTDNPSWRSSWRSSSSTYCALVGQLDESLAHQDRARALADQVDGLDEWLVGEDVLAMYCHTYLGKFSHGPPGLPAPSPPLGRALRRSPRCSAPASPARSPWPRGRSPRPARWPTPPSPRPAGSAFNRHYFAFSALRTAPCSPWNDATWPPPPI